MASYYGKTTVGVVINTKNTAFLAVCNMFIISSGGFMMNILLWGFQHASIFLIRVLQVCDTKNKKQYCDVKKI